MPLLPQSTADLVALDGLPRQATADDGSTHVLFLNTSGIVQSMLASAWPPPLPNDPTPQQSTAARALIVAAQAQTVSDAAALRARVLTLAQSAVGVQIDALTAAQIRALVALLLYKQGAIDKTGAIVALANWL